MKIQHLIPVLFLAAFCTVSAQTNNSEAFRSHRNQDDFAPIHAHQAELSLACGATMTNILKDIVKIAPEYPQLSGIGSAPIMALGARKAPTYQLFYRTNTHFVPIENSPNLPSPFRLEVDSDGIDLNITIADKESPTVAVTPPQNLLRVNGRSMFDLFCNITVNMPNDDLKNKINGIVETNVTVLKSNLRNILGVNPEQEKRELLVPVMTNILSKLKEIGPQYPLLSNVNSATIEDKGTNYFYQHLRFWNNAGATYETNTLADEDAFDRIKPVVEKGGIALDLYVLNRDEPFGFDPNPNNFDLISENRESKLVLAHTWYFNKDDLFHPDSSKQITQTIRAISKIIQDLGPPLRSALNNVISF